MIGSYNGPYLSFLNFLLPLVWEKIGVCLLLASFQSLKHGWPADLSARSERSFLVPVTSVNVFRLWFVFDLQLYIEDPTAKGKLGVTL